MRSLRPGLHCPVLVAALLALSACRPVDAGRPLAERETLADGTVVLRYADPGAGADTLVPDLRIGRADGAEWETFGAIAGIDVGAGGSVYVLDRQAMAVRVFDRAGGYRASLGGRGDGPGEFRQATGLLVSGRDTVWVRDQGVRRVVVLSPDGRELDRIPIPTSGSGGDDWEAALGADGTLWQTWAYTVGDSPPPNVLTGLTESTRNSWARRTDPRTHATDSVFLSADPVWFVRFPQPPGYASGAVPFMPRRLVAITRSGVVWTGLTNAYRITRQQEGGQRMVVEVDYAGPLITDVQRASWQGLLRQSEADLPVPDRPRAVVRVFVDDRERLWVQRQVAEGEASHFDVFGPDGQLLGAVRLPADLPVAARPVVRGGHFHAAVLGELGVPLVIRAPLPRWAR